MPWVHKGKGDCLFLMIYKDQQAANTIFWPVLSFLQGLQKLLPVYVV